MFCFRFYRQFIFFFFYFLLSLVVFTQRPGPPPHIVKTTSNTTTLLYSSSSTSVATTPSPNTTSPYEVLMALQLEEGEEHIEDENITLEQIRHMLPANITQTLEELNISFTDFLLSENMVEILNNLPVPAEPPDKTVPTSDNSSATHDVIKDIMKSKSLLAFLKSVENVGVNFTNHNRTILNKLYLYSKISNVSDKEFTLGHEILRVDFTKINLVLPTTATKPKVSSSVGLN